MLYRAASLAQKGDGFSIDLVYIDNLSIHGALLEL